MSPRLTEPLLVVLGLAYLLLFGWAVTAYDYDTWGAFVVFPPLAVLGVVILRRMFSGELATVGTIMIVGLFLKFAGSLARHWVGFEAYQGAIDAGRYHDYAVDKATAVWSFEADVWTLIPDGTGTPFMEDVTAIIYALTGASLLGGFLVFGWLAYIGTAFMVKAACIAVPQLAGLRYALLCVLAPSIVYWPSSIGKEAWMFLTLGIATYGIARALARKGLVVPGAVAAVGLLGAAMVRPHMAALWIAGAVPALILLLVARPAGGEARPPIRDRLGAVLVVAVAVVGLVVAAGATVRYLDFEDEEGEVTATAIFEETTRRTLQAGSNFDPPSIDNPANWPFASVRTLTRPLLIEARGSGQLLSALEMTVLIGIAVVSWRRLVNLPRQLVSVPFVAFAMTVLFFGSLAFTSFANLGVLTRQRTLLFPFLLLILCLPTRREVDEARTAREDVEAAEAIEAATGWGDDADTADEVGPGSTAAVVGASSGWTGSAARSGSLEVRQRETSRPLERASAPAEAASDAPGWTPSPPRSLAAGWQPSRPRARPSQ